jgi:hypothetical protein
MAISLNKRLHLNITARMASVDPAKLDFTLSGTQIDCVLDWWPLYELTASDRYSADFPRMPLPDPDAWKGEEFGFTYNGGRVFANAANARALGRCIKCGARALPGRASCEACAATQRATSRERYRTTRGAGRCVVCMGAALDGRPYCALHSSAARERGAERYYGRKACGDCTRCGSCMTPAEAGEFLVCAPCRRTIRVTYVLEGALHKRKRGVNRARSARGDVGPRDGSGRRLRAIVVKGRAELLDHVTLLASVEEH